MSGSAININADIGPLVLGGLLAFGLSGCVNMQFIVYWQIYPEEGWPTKLLVIATWLLDLCHSAFVATAIWDSVVAPFGDWSLIDIIPWSVGPTVELTAMVTFLVQSFFVYRIYRLQKNKLTVAGPVFTLAFIRLVTASVSMAEMIRLKHYSAFVHPFPSWVFTLGLSLSAFVDIVITTFLCYFLRSSHSPVPTRNRIVDILTVWTLQNGSVTCLGAVCSLICWTIMPQNRIFLGLHFVLAKLYANSLLATLNARCKIRKSRKFNTLSQPSPIVFPPSQIGGGDGPVTPRSPGPWSMRLNPFNTNMKRGQSRVEVTIHQTIESKYDHQVEIDVLSTTAESLREHELE